LLSGLKINRQTIGRDTLAGLTAAIDAIPDGMASAVLAGVNPVFGLYNLIIGTPVGALVLQPMVAYWRRGDDDCTHHLVSVLG
jgi:MFS superfamily sulfate permease-like transporter